MRGTYVALALAALSLGAGGYLFWSDYRDSRAIDISPNQSVARIKAEFLSQNSPEFTINSEEVRQGRAGELLDPGLSLPHLQLYPYNEISALYQYSQKCKGHPVHLLKSVLKKALIWQEFLCKERLSLPTGFFNKAPYMHPGGRSFAYLARMLDVPPFNKSEWLKSNSRYFHLRENACGKDDVSCIERLPLRQLSLSFTAENIKDLLAGDSLIEGAHYVLLLSRMDPPFSSSEYKVYPLDRWRGFLGQKSLLTQSPETSGCLIKEGSLCWGSNEIKRQKNTAHTATLFAFGLLILASILISQIVRKNILEKRTARRQKFILQMLTHEIRTPATSLTLSLETLRREFDKLPIQSQTAFLRICDQTQRLSRVIEASKQYLISDGRTDAVKFKSQRLPSVNSFFETILERYEDKIIFTPLTSDKQASIDRYWLELCLNNLIDNAISHGQPPVTVSLQMDGKTLIISVQDQGHLHGNTIDEVAIPFKKGSESRGLGLGLVLVRKIAQAMDGELTLSCSPTTFSLKLKNLS